MAKTVTRTVQLPVTLTVGATGADTATPTTKAVRDALDLVVIPSELLFVDNEVPLGDKNGANADFVLDYDPDGTEEVFLNGLLQCPGATEDYTISTTTITMLTVPAAGDVLLVNYHYEPALC
jgi:hypothetical protein